MIIKWFGHSCFLITSSAGTRILTDPPDPTVGYDIPKIASDAVTSSHAHHDHAYFEVCEGDVPRITEPGEYRVKEVRITGVPTFHDEVRGAKRGNNTVFIFEIDGMRVVHAGDIGAMPDADTMAKIGRPDVFLVPVGGVYTLDAAGAWELTNALHPKVVIPMHYKTPACTIELDGVAPFISSVRNCSIHGLRECECVLTGDSLGNDRVIILTYAKEQ